MLRGEPLASGTARSLIVLVSFTWGFNWVATRILLQFLPPLTLRSVAVDLGALVLFCVAALKGDELWLPRGERTKVAVAGFFNVAVFNACAVYSQVFGSTSRAVVIAYSMPIWAFLLGRWWLKEKSSPAKLTGIFLCAAGLALLLVPASDQGIPLGALFALACALSWAIGTIYQKQANLTVSLVCSTAWQLLLGGLVLTVCMLASEGMPHLAQLRPAPAVVLLAYSGFIAMGFAYFLWFVALANLPATTASIGTLLVPTVGVVVSVVMNGERPTFLDSVGFFLIFVSAGIVLLEPSLSRRQQSY
jgi:drug/metabolite transporter (DMT)-like permease